MSVIIVGIILVLGIVAMLANYRPAPTSSIVTQLPPPPINTTTIHQPQQPLNITKYTAYYNFLEALEGLNTTSSYKFNSSTLFDFGYGYNPLASAIADLLSLPANQITPWTYSEIYNVLDSNYTDWTSSKTVSLYYYPMNPNGSTVYLNFTYQTNPQFVNAYQELNKSYPFPPSDQVTVNSPVYKIINKTSVYTSVIFSLFPVEYLVDTYSYSVQEGGMTYCYVYYYYAMDIYGTAYLLANGNYISSQNFMTTFYWYGGSYSNNVYGYVTVPPGVQKQVYAGYNVYSNPGYYTYSVLEGNKTIIYNFYYPTYPYTTTQDYYFNWYEYNVALPLKILVYNGSNPITYVNNQVYNSRSITAYVSYSVWSSDPKSYTVTIKTLDHVMFMKYNLTRAWYAGSITINPTCYTQTFGNIINYYLSFSFSSNLNSPPPYIFEPIPPLNRTAVLQWSYFFNNYSVAEGLFDAVHKNIDQFNFILPQFVTSLFTNNLTEHTITLASFIEPWNVSQVTLNVSNVLVKTEMIFIPVNITANTTYAALYSALGSNYVTPNVTLLNYEWNNLTGSGFFPPLQDALYNGTLPPAYYSPFTNKIWLNYGVYWPYGLPYAQFEIENLEKTYQYWYNPGWDWFPIS
jgi:hypothetical protein